MEDENNKEDQTTSKDKNDQDMDDKDIKTNNDNESDDSSFTASSLFSGSRSDVKVIGTANFGNGQKMKTERKKKTRRGRVIKRKKSANRRATLQKRSTNAVNKNKTKPASGEPAREQPVKPNASRTKPSRTTIVSYVSSISSYDSVDLCSMCGKRKCGRRVQYEVSRKERKHRVREVIKHLREARLRERKHGGNEPQIQICSNEQSGIPRISGFAGVQVGSCCKMLSPLFIRSNSTELESEQPLVDTSHMEITPEMIYESMKRLTMWRQFVTQASILEHIKLNYPVNKNTDELNLELSEKLKIAAIVGIVLQYKRNTKEYWSLSHELQKRRLTKNHVTKFWKVYGDTLSPIEKNPLYNVR